MSPPSKNILFHAIPAWGHKKPMIALAVIITRARPDIIVTMITTGVLYSKIMKELKSKLSTQEYSQLSSRIHVIDVAGPAVSPFEPLAQFGPAYDALCNSEPITCKSSEQTFSELPPPVVAIIDPFANYAYEHIHATPRFKIPIISWISAPAGSLLRIFGPASLGSIVDPSLDTDAGLKAARVQTSLAPSEILTEDKKLPPPSSAPATFKYEISKIPGLPPLYIHEWSPQINLLSEGSNLPFLGAVYTRLSDGVIIVSNSVYEKEPMKATKSWLEQIGKPSYAMAPLSLPKPRTQVDSDQETLRFLDSIEEQFGPNSLIYISFGTFWWPPQQEKLVALIEALIANKKPFILSHASPLAAKIPDGLLTSIKSSGIGLALSWSPQETILHHEATGWFITHGGWNSIQESFEAKVPLIFWPMGADQPLNAAVLGLTHKAAFELIEVRSGEDGTKPLLRFENTGYNPTFTVDAVKAEVERLLVRIDGEEGRMVRSNFRELGQAMQKSWNDGEEGRMELNEFLKKFVDGI
ncbi:glycosyltransferase family 1 protein [Collybiopsis luxurians FD-317 M1]|uniref:Glycosyltransferase family 1 protein n=1 Tax=Collybiopsis luxurians FD-317 M1 TaxID=944289 RepID=A0A0D0CSW1_9AGAR|nr:glycosyltransferase family 1 protein [Collybiopsis luxurians FD-317 M1]